MCTPIQKKLKSEIKKVKDKWNTIAVLIIWILSECYGMYTAGAELGILICG